jgi:hypothetical protein
MDVWSINLSFREKNETRSSNLSLLKMPARDTVRPISRGLKHHFRLGWSNTWRGYCITTNIVHDIWIDVSSKGIPKYFSTSFIIPSSKTSFRRFLVFLFLASWSLQVVRSHLAYDDRYSIFSSSLEWWNVVKHLYR